MKCLIVSDIHGSSYYMMELEKIIQKEQPNKIILLGDLLYCGFYNQMNENYDRKKVIEILNRYKDKMIAVRGNCDSDEDQAVLDFPMMSDYRVLEIDGLKMYLTHGHINRFIPYQDGILIQGHTHHYQLSSTYINPGSLSMPRGHKEHTFIIYENRCFTLYDIDGHILKKLTL